MWKFVRRRFRSLLANIELTAAQVGDGDTKQRSIVSALNRAYWEETDTTAHSFRVGSWGKLTAIRPPSDVDLFFLPPMDEFHTFSARQGNSQSQLLQDMRSKLQETFPQTQIRGDGQVVQIAFNSILFEVVPAFSVSGGGYFICDTNDGGTWKHVDADLELVDMNVADDRHAGNVRKLVRILKQWKHHRGVPIKGFHLEQLVKETLENSNYSYRDEFWFDWLVRDVFYHLVGRAGGHFYMPGRVIERIELGNDWKDEAEVASELAAQACYYEQNEMNVSAGLEWKKIFGNQIPTEVT